MNSMPIRVAMAVAVLSFFSGLAGNAQAQSAASGTVDLLTTPPELTAKVAPNVVYTHDDSGSMTWNFMPDQRPYSGVEWFTGTKSQTAANNATFPSSRGRYFCAGVIDPDRPDPKDTSDPYTWPMNGVYYDPNVEYKPPLKADGSSFPDIDYTNAPRNGIDYHRPNSPVTGSSSNPRYDLSSNSSSAGKRFCDNRPGYYRYTGSALSLDSTGKFDSTSLSRLYTNSNWTWVDINSGTTEQKQNFANWFSYYRTRQMAAISASTHAFDAFDQNIRVAWQNINSGNTYNTNGPLIKAGTTTLTPFEGTVRDNFYKWMHANPASGGTPNLPATKRVGKLFQYGASTNKKTTKNPYYDPDTGRELACRKNFHILMTDGMWNFNSDKYYSQPGDYNVPRKDTVGTTLPDGKQYSTSELQSKIYWNEGSKSQYTLADLAFYYWSENLRPDLPLLVRPYLADRTTGITGGTSYKSGDDWLENKELYWNPANNPASWPHLVQFMIGFGVDGTIPKTEANYERLRKGEEQWPKLSGSSPNYDNSSEKIDDMWHAAINSRGDFFSAGSPDALIDALQKIIASVVAQSTSSTPAAVSLPILTGGNSAYSGGYDTSGWSGSLTRRTIDRKGQAGDAEWDAGCLLTGGQCADPGGTNEVRSPSSRTIFTSNGQGTGISFQWGSLNSTQRKGLVPPDGSNAATGQKRVDYIRGDRTSEVGGANPRMRSRMSVLGAIVNGEPAYVSSPRSGYRDLFPEGSPEYEAAISTTDGRYSYAGYQNAYSTRRPALYVGSNDGMLHAFDAKTGEELWAYIPNVLIENGRLYSSTLQHAGLVPGVDSQARERDVFINGEWRTILLGSLRLGGRGIYALDVTEPEAANASGTDKVLWEFTNGNTLSKTSDGPCSAGSRTCASLGYTYDSANVARIAYQNKWVAVVSSGYFPNNKDSAAKASDITEPAANRTSLLIIDLETGQLIRELRTTAAPQTKPDGFKTYGLSTPMVYDEGSDEVDDLVYAGDLAGNLWRFDLSSEDPDQWKVDLMFTTYGNGGATNAGDQPIAFNPTALADPATRRPILVLGTGKYLGEEDRTSQIPEQAWYGIRDYGTRSSNYPIRVNQLLTQTLSQTGDTRSITGRAAPSSQPTGVPEVRIGEEAVRAHGWRMRLNVAAEPGERAQRRAIPLSSANLALVYGLIPKSDDPCDPGARYSVMAVDASTGGALGVGDGEALGSGLGIVGGVAKAASPPADPVVVRGGGTSTGGSDGESAPRGLVIPGLELDDEILDVLGAAAPPWHRGAWRDLQGQD